jgi:hypothetical protein
MIALITSVLLVACDGASSTSATLTVHESSAIARLDILDLIRTERLADLVNLLRSERPSSIDLGALDSGESMVVVLKGYASSEQPGGRSVFSTPEPDEEWIVVAEFTGKDVDALAVDVADASQLIFAIWSTRGPQVPYCMGRMSEGEINLKTGDYRFVVSALETGSLAARSDCENLSFRGTAEDIK